MEQRATESRAGIALRSMWRRFRHICTGPHAPVSIAGLRLIVCVRGVHALPWRQPSTLLLPGAMCRSGCLGSPENDFPTCRNKAISILSTGSPTPRRQAVPHVVHGGTQPHPGNCALALLLVPPVFPEQPRNAAASTAFDDPEIATLCTMWISRYLARRIPRHMWQVTRLG